MVRFFLLILCLAVFAAPGAFAQEKLRVRTGDHDSYSRIVFDWTEKVSYELQKAQDDGRLIIAFEKPASLMVAGSVEDQLKNVFGFQKISTSPLKVAVDYPQGSKTKVFYAGTKIVLDIYNPPGGVRNPPEQVVAQQPKPEAPQEKAAPAPLPAPEKEEKGSERPAAVQEKKPDVEKPEEVVKKEPAPEAEAIFEEENIKSVLLAQSESMIPPHVITITSTKNVGVAVFELYGDLWLVTDQDEFYLKPQINGPNPEMFPAFKEKKAGVGKAYATRVPEGGHAAGQGGGLLWRVVISSKENEKEPLEPVREHTRPDSVRGGKIIWPFEEASKIIEFEDPVSGEILKVITTGTSRDFSGPRREFVDFEVLPSYIGLVIRSKVDDLSVQLTKEGVEISRPGGLALMPENQLALALKRVSSGPGDKGGVAVTPKKVAPRIFSFNEWQMGGIRALNQNENIILSQMKELPEGERYESLITLARMHLSNGRGAEALGFLEFALSQVPELESNEEFLALRGVAYAIDGKSEDAFRDLSIKSLKPFEEIGYWRAFALADLGDWQQAYQVMPADVNVLYDYPEVIRNQLALVLAEISLRAGNIDAGETLLEMVDQNARDLPLHQKAALKYLKGEAQRQAGYPEETEKLWKPLTRGKDDLYRAKAGLALTRLQIEEGKISQAKAIDNMERLRYVWRGDQLEAAINYWLGRTYFDAGEYVKGLHIMREATTFAAGTKLGHRITEEMTEAFTDLFLGDDLENVTALDAVALYEQFSELTPAGPKGDKVVEMLAERLVQADLLDRAGDILQHQVEHRLEGADAARVAVRMAAIRLLDSDPDKAQKALDKASALWRALPPEVATPDKFHEIALLRARALSQAKRPDQAIALLEDMEPTPDVNRLRADIAWKAAYWDDAAAALEDVILDQDISLTRPLKDEQAVMILNRAIALNLASDRIALANMREKYADAMAQTEKARLFEVVTRPRQNAALADRQTLLSIVSEVDMFEGFLNSYRGTQAPSN